MTLRSKVSINRDEIYKVEVRENVLNFTFSKKKVENWFKTIF